uniref:Suppressor of cytokine signaling 7 n=1 Tax=Seriola dumerili TaxID=41447 RepID=A0A3B4UVG3_SERDU
NTIRNLDPVLALARRLGQLGEGREGGGGGGGREEMVLPLPRCSCHSVLASGSGGIGPGEDPSETSDALLVLEGLGSEEVGGLGPQTGGGGGGLHGPELPVLVGCPGCCSVPTSMCGLPPPHQQHHYPLSVPPCSRATTPKLGVASGGAGRSASPLVVLEGEVGGGGGREGEKTPRGKSRKGGSLKVRLSKLFRTKSSSGGSGGLLDKRPSLASSTSSGGSLLDVWGSTCSTEQDSNPPVPSFAVPFTPAFTEQVSLVDVDISLRGGNSLHSPDSSSPPRRSLQSARYCLPRPVPLRPDGQHPPPRLAPRCPLSRPDASSFATSLRELEKCGWYWGPMNWEDAEMKLKGKPDGSFLVRDSSDPRYILSLSFRSQGVTHHTRMEHYRGTFSLWCHPKFEDRCHSVVEFIERAIMHSKNGKFLYFLRSRVPGLPPTPVQLLYPVSRFSSVKSLQHLCRFCIRQLVRIDHIQELPLPTPLISYLRKFYYYDPEEEIIPPLKERGPEQSSQPGVEAQT